MATVHFAHDSISDKYRLPYRSILDTLKDLASGSLKTQEVEIINVIWSEDIAWRKGKGDNL